MGFNAGGTNVGGVQQTEQGILKCYEINTTFSAAATISVDHTVPAGKKWILKGAATGTGTFVGTIGSSTINVYVDGHQQLLNITPSATNMAYVTPNTITLSAGQMIRFRINASIYTSGQQFAQVLVQEITI